MLKTRLYSLCFLLTFGSPGWTQPATESVAQVSDAAGESAEALPKARNIDLEDPVPVDALVPDDDDSVETLPKPDADVESASEAQPAATRVAPELTLSPTQERTETPDPDAEKVLMSDEAQPQAVANLVMLGNEVAPGTSARLSWVPAQSFEGIFSPTPVMIVHGTQPGPVLCLTAAVHGDELNGIETVRRVMYGLDAGELSGTVIGVPIVNLQGFHRSSRYLADRRDLNRFFPGDPDGSLASRIADSFFKEVVVHCDALVDLHTGSYHRTNMPQLRADLNNAEVLALGRGFGATVMLHSAGAGGTLRRAATEAGVPAVTLEAGSSMLLDEKSVNHSYQAIQSLLHHMDMVSKFRLWGQPEPVFYKSSWQRAPVGGVIFSQVKLGDAVAAGDLLGTITNPITNVRTELLSNHTGRILGMALNQFVQPGFAAYHIGIQAPPEELVAESDDQSKNRLSGDEDTEDDDASSLELPDEDPVEAPLED